MFCPQCGTQNPEGSAFCSQCGARFTAPAPSTPAAPMPTAGMSPAQAPVSNAPVPYAPAPDLPMRWYKFLIWFSLFLGALVNAVGGIMALTGAQYGEDARLVYAFYGNGLKAFDVFYGVLLLGMAVATILVRQGLAHYKKEAPMYYLALMGANIALSVVYALGVSLITGLGFFSIFDASSWGSTIGTAILIVCNYFYFDKRKHLFCR